MEKLRQLFTEWYFRHGWTFEYDFNLGVKPAWNCPFYVKPLLVLFSPSVYFMCDSADFARGFEEGYAEAFAELSKMRKEEDYEYPHERSGYSR